MAIRLRRYWLLVHRWLGLTVGLVFVVLGLTGSLLVFDHAIDECLNPELLLTRGSGQRAPLEKVIGAAEQSYSGQAVSVSKPRVENGVWTVWFSSGSERETVFTAVYVDPYTLRITGQRVWGHDLMSWIYRLHYTLLAGRPGAVLVGVIGIVFILSIASGVYLWWPLWLHSFRAALAIRRGHLFVFDVHKTIGIVSCSVLGIVAFTGVYMEFPDWFRSTVGIALPISDRPPETQSIVRTTSDAISADQAIAIAEKLFPHARWDHLHPPTDVDGVFEVALRQPNEVQRSYGRTQVYIDRYSGAVTAVVNPNQSTVADAFFAAQFPFHNGEAFGLVGRLVVLLSGFSPALLYATGLFLWCRKRRSKKRLTPSSST
ncbi:MAG: PepSY-associated TM helix domain-containing protein [Aureliella sp.]